MWFCEINVKNALKKEVWLFYLNRMSSYSRHILLHILSQYNTTVHKFRVSKI